MHPIGGRWSFDRMDHIQNDTRFWVIYELMNIFAVDLNADIREHIQFVCEEFLNFVPISF